MNVEFKISLAHHLARMKSFVKVLSSNETPPSLLATGLILVPSGYFLTRYLSTLDVKHYFRLHLPF